MENIKKLFGEIYQAEKQFILDKLEIAKKEKIFENIEYVSHNRIICDYTNNFESYSMKVKFKFNDNCFLEIEDDIHYQYGYAYYYYKAVIYDGKNPNGSPIYYSKYNSNDANNNKKLYDISDSFIEEFVEPIVEMLVCSVECQNEMYTID